MGIFDVQSQKDTLSVLVVDDERSNRVILRAYLEKDGYTVLEASDGKRAVEIYKDHFPDIILMDVMMPEMDGYEATRRIKAYAGERFVPIIFLTAASNEAALAKCIECGGDDFLTKPYSRVIIQAKIHALWRLRLLTTELHKKSEQIELHHQRLQQEHEFAERIFTKIVKSRQFTTAGIRMHIAPMGIASGDLVLAAKHPIDGRYIMVGDFTGHGLAAALGAIPVSDIFYSMTSKGLPLPMLVTEINKKLCEKLPTGFFMAACFLYIRDSSGSVEAWVGGVPEVIVVDAHGKVVKRVASNHLPLGVDKSAQDIGAVDAFSIDGGERIFAYTDGVIDLRNSAGEMFGMQRLNEILDSGRAPDYMFDDLFAALTAYRGGSALSDDLTLVEVSKLILELTNAEEGDQKNFVGAVDAVIWRVEFLWQVAGLREYDLNRWVGEVLDQIPDLIGKKAGVHTAIAEMMSNAVDHGVLRLDSRGKGGGRGFEAYYSQRENALKSLDEGFVKLEMEFRRVNNGRELTFTVTDSGVGFDHEKLVEQTPDTDSLSGRGLMLTRSLGVDIHYNDAGNQVKGLFRW